MLSINEINLLKAQNEGLKKQNKQLQKEIKNYEERNNYINNFLADLGISATGELKRISFYIAKMKKTLDEIRKIAVKNEIISSEQIISIIDKAKDGNND